MPVSGPFEWNCPDCSLCVSVCFCYLWSDDGLSYQDCPLNDPGGFFLGFLVMSYLQLVLPRSGSSWAWPHFLHDTIQMLPAWECNSPKQLMPKLRLFLPYLQGHSHACPIERKSNVWGRAQLSGAQRWCIKLAPIHLSTGWYELAGVFQKPLCPTVLQTSHSWFDHGWPTNPSQSTCTLLTSWKCIAWSKKMSCVNGILPFREINREYQKAWPFSSRSSCLKTVKKWAKGGGSSCLV